MCCQCTFLLYPSGLQSLPWYGNSGWTNKLAGPDLVLPRLYHLSKCTDLSLSSFLPVDIPGMCFFEVTAGVVWHDRTISWLYDPRGKEASVLGRVSLPQCSEDIGFGGGFGGLDLAGCPLQGPWFSHHAGLLFILASGLAASLPVQLPGSKILPGPSLELKNVDWG